MTDLQSATLAIWLRRQNLQCPLSANPEQTFNPLPTATNNFRDSIENSNFDKMLPNDSADYADI